MPGHTPVVLRGLMRPKRGSHGDRPLSSVGRITVSITKQWTPLLLNSTAVRFNLLAMWRPITDKEQFKSSSLVTGETMSPTHS